MRLEVKTAKLTRSYGDRFESGKIEPSDWLLVLTVEPLGRNPMELATGEKLSSCEMSVTFRPAREGRRQWLDEHSPKPGMAIGMLHYFGDHVATQPDDEDHDASLIFDVGLDADEFTGLVELARAGRFPHDVSVSFPHDLIEYHHGGFRWDNSKSRILPISAVDVVIELSEAPLPDGESMALDKAVGAAPRTPVGADLRPTLERLIMWQQATLWVIVVVAVIAWAK